MDQPKEPADMPPGESHALHSPYTAFAVMCEHAEALPDGSVTITRIVDRWGISGAIPPFGISFWTAIGLKGMPTGKSQVRVSFIRERDQVEVLNAVHDLDLQGTSINLLAEIPVFPIDEFGAYRLRVEYQEREVGAYPFEVRADPPTGDS